MGLALVAFGAGGCAKKVTVDPLHAALVEYPEGDSVRRTPSPSDLVVWMDLPVLVTEVWPSRNDSSTFDSYRSGPGAIQGVILDYRQASAYQVFREEAIGGYHQFSDYLRMAEIVMGRRADKPVLQVQPTDGHRLEQYPHLVSMFWTPTQQSEPPRSQETPRSNQPRLRDIEQPRLAKDIQESWDPACWQPSAVT